MRARPSPAPPTPRRAARIRSPRRPKRRPDVTPETEALGSTDSTVTEEPCC
ncbi:MAG: hypothetical protein U0325_31855 [Polyangiales bacterium]